MGRAKTTRQAFFAAHPVCCFCGGAAPATTEDHVPSRAFFNGRVWPEGFAFPACDRCNAATANDEQLAALVCRMGKLDASPEDKQHTLRLMQGVHNNFPGLLAAMQQGPAAKRRWLREHGMLMQPRETTDDFGLVSVEDVRIHDAMAQFGRKLLLALYYRHTQAIFPAAGSFAFRWFGNTNLDEIHPVVAQITTGLTMPNRANTSLGEQFFYRFGVADTGRATAFLAVFHEASAVLGVMLGYETQIDPSPVGRVLKSFSWD